jgi:hypothetical protein
MANYFMLGGDSKEYGPVSAAQLRSWVSQGRANQQTQVRLDGAADWQELGAVAELAGVAIKLPPVPSALPAAAASPYAAASVSLPRSSGTGGDTVRRLAQTLSSAGGWMIFVGIVTIIQAALLLLSTAGMAIVVAWLPIWIGIVLIKAAGRAKKAATSGDEGALREALNQLNLYFKLSGVMMLFFLLGSLLMAMFMGVILHSLQGIDPSVLQGLQLPR